MSTFRVVKELTNIVDVVSSYLPLEQRGVNYFGICPFHDDNTPSLTVSPKKQIFKCFVCDEGGDVFDFVSRHEGVSTKKALKILADQVGVEYNFTPASKDPAFSAMIKMQDMFEFSYGNLLTNEVRQMYPWAGRGYEAAFDLGYQRKQKEINKILEENHMEPPLGLPDKVVTMPVYKGDSIVGFGYSVNEPADNYECYLEFQIYKDVPFFNLNNAKRSIRRTKKATLWPHAKLSKIERDHLVLIQEFGDAHINILRSLGTRRVVICVPTKGEDVMVQDLVSTLIDHQFYVTIRDDGRDYHALNYYHHVKPIYHMTDRVSSPMLDHYLTNKFGKTRQELEDELPF